MAKTSSSIEELDERQELLHMFFGEGPQYTHEGRLYTPSIYSCEHFTCRYSAGMPEHDGYHNCAFYEDRLECQCHICRHYDGISCSHPAKRKI